MNISAGKEWNNFTDFVFNHERTPDESLYQLCDRLMKKYEGAYIIGQGAYIYSKEGYIKFILEWS